MLHNSGQIRIMSKCKDYQLNLHEYSEYGKPKFSCEECGKQYTSNVGLINHIDSIHRNIWHKYEQRGKEFTTKNGRSTHIKSIHEKQKINSFS